MPYRPLPETKLFYAGCGSHDRCTVELSHRDDNLHDWRTARPGQWFIGVVDTNLRRIYLVPVNIFDDGGTLNQEMLNNTYPRGINRYASGAHGERYGIMQGFLSFVGGNWLSSGPNSITYHSCVALRYHSDPADCLGFSLIKLAPSGFAQIKFSSASLNSKPGAYLNYNFSQATATRGAKTLGSPQMPPQWANAVVQYLKGEPFNIVHIAKSGE